MMDQSSNNSLPSPTRPAGRLWEAISRHFGFRVTGPDSRSSVFASAWILCLLFLSCTWVSPLEAQLQSAGNGNSQSIRLGNAVVFPGTNEALVPVYLTSEVDIQSWQMGLEYDELLLNLIDVEFTGTESELLDPILLPVISGTSMVGFEVFYPGPDYFPADAGLLAAFLRFEWIGTGPIPVPGGTSTEINVIDLESLPVAITSPNGLVLTPETQSGSVVALDYPLYLLEETTATLVETTALVPIRAWSQGPSTTFMMGLEYDELLLTQVVVDGSDLDALSGGSWTLTSTPTATGLVCTIESTLVIPALDGQIIGFLKVDRPGNLPGEPGWGPWALNWQAANCEIDGEPVSYLEPGSIRWISHFIRGDANLDSSLDIADAETILGACYMGLPVECEDAADSNDDGSLDISDVVSVLQFLFSGSPSPPLPYPDAGSDPSADNLNCD